MSSATSVHPEQVLEGLLSRGHRPQVQRTLRAIHEICKEQNERGTKDFSLATIGREAEKRSICKAKILYNATSAIYRELITGWASYAGPPAPPPPKELASVKWLMMIENPALRSLIQSVVVERDKLKAQLNSLKAREKAVIDRRPHHRSMTTTSDGAMALVEVGAQLSDSEREALEAAISPEFLDEQGWCEGERGEIKTIPQGKSAKGRLVYRPGYADAIRRFLGRAKKGSVKVVS